MSNLHIRMMLRLYAWLCMGSHWVDSDCQSLSRKFPLHSRRINTCCCSCAVGRTTRRHPATSSCIFFPLHLFSPRSCHRLSTAEHRLFMHAVLLLPGKHFPSISPSIVARTTLSLLLFQWQYLESFRCLICSKMPFSSDRPIFSRIHVLVFRSVRLILSIRRHTQRL